MHMKNEVEFAFICIVSLHSIDPNEFHYILKLDQTMYDGKLIKRSRSNADRERQFWKY